MASIKDTMYKSFQGSTKQAYIALLSFMSRFCFVPSFDFYKTSSVIMLVKKSEEFVVVLFLFWSSLRNILSFDRFSFFLCVSVARSVSYYVPVVCGVDAKTSKIFGLFVTI